jgi:flagellar hook-basal body complex protein FliE
VVVPVAAIGAIAPLTVTPAASAATTTTGGADFATALSNGLDAVSGAQATADSLAVQAATGTLADPAQYTIAATQASLLTQLATTLESKAVAAFNQVMAMQA